MMLCTREDVFLYGLPRAALSQPARPLAGINVASNFFELGSHNLQPGTPVSLICDRGRVPRPLLESVTYAAIPVTEDRFRLSEEPFPVPPDVPDPIVIEDVGAGVVKLTVRLGRQLDTFIAHFSAWVNTNTPAHEPYTDTEPVPDEIRMIVAVRAAAAMCRATGKVIQTVFDQETAILRDWTRMQRGVPLRAPEQGALTNLAMGASPSTESIPKEFF